MTTGDEAAQAEYARLMQEVQLANLRETHRLLTSRWHRIAPAIAAGAMIFLAVLAGAVMIGAAAAHVGL